MDVYKYLDAQQRLNERNQLKTLYGSFSIFFQIVSNMKSPFQSLVGLLTISALMQFCEADTLTISVWTNRCCAPIGGTCNGGTITSANGPTPFETLKIGNIGECHDIKDLGSIASWEFSNVAQSFFNRNLHFIGYLGHGCQSGFNIAQSDISTQDGCFTENPPIGISSFKIATGP